MDSVEVGEVTVEVTVGDITDQPDADAVVNAANAELASGGGVAGAIHAAAGPELHEACRPLAPIAVGEAVVTGGFDLPNRHVIHVLGPRYGLDEPAADLLADCYRNALRAADAHGLDSVAFPAVSTGAFGYPLADAAEVAIGTVLETAPALANVRRIRFVLHDEASRQVHEDVLRARS